MLHEIFKHSSYFCCFGPAFRWMLHSDFTFHAIEGCGFRIHGLECAHKTQRNCPYPFRATAWLWSTVIVVSTTSKCKKRTIRRSPWTSVSGFVNLSGRYVWYLEFPLHTYSLTQTIVNLQVWSMLNNVYLRNMWMVMKLWNCNAVP